MIHFIQKKSIDFDNRVFKYFGILMKMKMKTIKMVMKYYEYNEDDDEYIKFLFFKKIVITCIINLSTRRCHITATSLLTKPHKQNWLQNRMGIKTLKKLK
jgi:hypothetical protein